MCILCVEIIRSRITVRDALDGLKNEVMANGSFPQGEDGEHKSELLQANADGNMKKLKELIKAGYKKERWL